MGKEGVKRKVGTCVACGTRYINAGPGCVCYLCMGAIGETIIKRMDIEGASPPRAACTELVNLLFSVREHD